MIEPDQMRRNVSDLLTLLSDVEAQREYQRDVPIASVPVEMRCMWLDDMYHPDDAVFRRAFSAEERAALAKFHAIYEAVTAEIRPWPEVLADLQALPAWDRVLQAASVALRVLSSARPLGYGSADDFGTHSGSSSLYAEACATSPIPN